MRPYGSLASLATRVRPAGIMRSSISSVSAITTRSASSSSGSSSGSNSSSSTSDLAQRSLFINVRPPPATLAERRSVLGVLERYGKAELFKKLADNSSFVCIASSTVMANALVQRSPLQYELLAETLEAAKPWGQPRVASLVQPIETPSTAADRSGAASGAAGSSFSSSSPEWSSSSTSSSSSSSGGAQHRSFVVSVFPSNDYHHRTVVRNNPLHGPWPYDRDEGPSGMATIVSSNTDNYRDTFVYNALRAVVPESASSAALCDWRSRQPATGYDADVAALSSTTPADRNVAARIQERRQRRAHANKSILSSLMSRKVDNGNSINSSFNGNGNGNGSLKSEDIKRPNR
ncbi:hypothetical protein Sste5346_000414 [Sporothrix stenoceras]|uniref:Pal1-like protein n=1 Tax=Sporothrix stenoceras TaxID=5173 RepID=A0ABR3ZR10_9PEZI